MHSESKGKNKREGNFEVIIKSMKKGSVLMKPLQIFYKENAT